jgi:hypothetical protein
METRRWTNPSQPQTLYIAHLLLYINAVISVILSGFNPIIVLFAAGGALAAYGIANERKWGYYLGLVVAGLELLPAAIGLYGNVGLIFNINFLLAILFPVALFILLIHPMSREYQRIWFK